MFNHTFKNGHTTICEYIKPDTSKTQRFTVVYTHGFCSDPWGRKPETVKSWCIEHGLGFFRWEVAGHGSDKSRFKETTINTYKEQLFEIIEDIVEGDIVVAGASMGGMLSLIASINYPNRVKGILGLAAAPDFLIRFIKRYFDEKAKAFMDKFGFVEYTNNDFTYVVTKEMIESGYQNMLLDKDAINFNGKVILIQGMIDASVNWELAPFIASKLLSQDVKVVLLKDSNHRLNRDEDIHEIRCALDDFALNLYK